MKFIYFFILSLYTLAGFDNFIIISDNYQDLMPKILNISPVKALGLNDGVIQTPIINLVSIIRSIPEAKRIGLSLEFKVDFYYSRFYGLNKTYIHSKSIFKMIKEEEQKADMFTLINLSERIEAINNQIFWGKGYNTYIDFSFGSIVLYCRGMLTLMYDNKRYILYRFPLTGMGRKRKWFSYNISTLVY